jgi:hypothetical protein
MTVPEMLKAMHDLTRKSDLVVSSAKAAQEEAKLVDPDTFPINKLSPDLVETYLSVWDLDKTLRKRMEMRYGHYLRLKPSLIDHHEAGLGVFLSCKRQSIVLPGTLLGLVPGVICDNGMPPPVTPKRSLRPYILRFDGTWLDYEKELPYPLPPPGTSFEEHFHDWQLQCELRGEKELKYLEVPAKDMNPYAVGHLINHPPPDTAANVKLIDFDLPYSFFPSQFSRYIPYINFREATSQSRQSETRHKTMRAVAVVAT